MNADLELSLAINNHGSVERSTELLARIVSQWQPRLLHRPERPPDRCWNNLRLLQLQRLAVRSQSIIAAVPHFAGGGDHLRVSTVVVLKHRRSSVDGTIEWVSGMSLGVKQDILRPPRGTYCFSRSNPDGETGNEC
jgi:hypothetical protein